MRRLTPARIIALGFALVILFGSLLLSLPFSIRDGVSLSYADALYTATSAVCVTGLVVVDIADTFTLFGQMVVLLLMQVSELRRWVRALYSQSAEKSILKGAH